MAFKRPDKFLIPGTPNSYHIKLAHGQQVQVVASIDGSWEHVSVSRRDRCPTWDEMCQVKDLFWDDEDCVVQYHPPKSSYVNLHPFCLHLWRRVNGDGEEVPV